MRHRAALAVGTVDLQPDRGLVDAGHRGGRVQRSDRRGVVEGLGQVPGPPLVTQLELQVAPRHVQAHGIAVDVLERVLHRDVAPAAADGQHELDLVVHVAGAGRIGEVGRLPRRGDDDGVGRLAEEERRLAVGVEAHLARVRSVVSADTVDPAHGKDVGGGGNGHGDGRGGRDSVAHGAPEGRVSARQTTAPQC